MKLKYLTAVVGIFVTCGMPQEQVYSPYGIFVEHGDIGAVKHAGSVAYDTGTDIYRVTGGRREHVV